MSKACRPSFTLCVSPAFSRLCAYVITGEPLFGPLAGQPASPVEQNGQKPTGKSDGNAAERSIKSNESHDGESLVTTPFVAMPFVPSTVLVPSSKAQEPLVATLLLVARPFAPSSFLLLLVRHLLLEAMHLFLVASLFPASCALPLAPLCSRPRHSSSACRRRSTLDASRRAVRRQVSHERPLLCWKLAPRVAGIHNGQ